ncbi:MAG: C25 family cysteine peptidase, partial [Candidatus Eiseniibacteriota bacterium]
MALSALGTFGTPGMVAPATASPDATASRSAPHALEVTIALDELVAAVEHSLAQHGDLSGLARAGYALLPRPAAPALPLGAVHVELPPGAQARAVTARPTASQRIQPGTLPRLAPPTILGLAPGAQLPAPDLPDGLFPATLAVLRGSHRLGARHLASCELHPVQYDPRSGELVVHTAIELSIELEVAAPPALARRTSAVQPPTPSSLAPLGERLLQPAGTTRLEIRERDGQERDRALDRDGPVTAAPGQALPVDPTAYRYVIITDRFQAPIWEIYAAWKTAKGLPATVVTVDAISGQSSGRDLAERIRTWIAAAVADWGTEYVLLAGDDAVVPGRVVYAFDCEAHLHADENDLRADLYYADLDGDWDANGNGIFGEVDDLVDLYPDLLVGRAPSGGIADASNMLHKFLAYERTPPGDHVRRAVLFGEILWQQPFTDAGIALDMIAGRHLGGFEIERRYETLGNESVTSVVSALDR